MTDQTIQSSASEAAPATITAPVADVSPVIEVSTDAALVIETGATEAIDTVLGVDDAGVDASTIEVTPEVKTDVPAEDKPAEIQKPAEDGADKPLPEGEKKEEVSQSDEPAPLPSYEPWTFPEGIEIDEAQMGEVSKLFGEFEQLTKADHALVQKFGQQMIDRHISGVQAAINQLTEAYQQSWKDQTKSWYDSFAKDPEIGGDKKEASAAAAREFIRRHGGSTEQQNELRTLMQKTGIGNHPAVIRAFAKATANLAEPTLVPAGKPPAEQTSRKQRFYGKKS